MPSRYQGSHLQVPLDDDLPASEEVEDLNEKYSKVLDILLTPPHVKHRLMTTQTVEQKRKIVNTHNSTFNRRASWENKENKILNAIKNDRHLDIKNITTLKVMLSSANREFMQAFLDNNGVPILLKSILQYNEKIKMTDGDVAILFELILCCKLVMNNSMGMEAFLSVVGSIDTIALCLRFEHKYLALQVHFILTQYLIILRDRHYIYMLSG